MFKKMSNPVVTPEAKNLNERTAQLADCAEFCNKVCSFLPERLQESFYANEILP